MHRQREITLMELRAPAVARVGVSGGIVLELPAAKKCRPSPVWPLRTAAGWPIRVNPRPIAKSHGHPLAGPSPKHGDPATRGVGFTPLMTAGMPPTAVATGGSLGNNPRPSDPESSGWHLSFGSTGHRCHALRRGDSPNCPREWPTLRARHGVNPEPRLNIGGGQWWVPYAAW